MAEPVYSEIDKSFISIADDPHLNYEYTRQFRKETGIFNIGTDSLNTL